jgi:hypothetical protein
MQEMAQVYSAYALLHDVTLRGTVGACERDVTEEHDNTNRTISTRPRPTALARNLLQTPTS